MQYTKQLGYHDMVQGNEYYFPFQLKNGDRLAAKSHATLFDLLDEPPAQDAPVANLSKETRKYLSILKIDQPDADFETASLIWFHALAIGYTPSYLAENSDGIRQDWPRIPLPDSIELLTASANLGRAVADLLDPTAEVRGLNAGKTRPELKTIAVVARIGGGSLDESKDLAVTSGWGHVDTRGATMPGQGMIVERDYSPEEFEAIRTGAELLELNREQALDCLGQTTRDMYLNDRIYWQSIPACVWDHTIGGYQVLKKWLSYRELDILGRPLTVEEVREFTAIAQRIAGVLLLGPRLDSNLRDVVDHLYPWNADADESERRLVL